MKDLIIVDTPEALLIMPREQSADVKHVVEIKKTKTRKFCRKFKIQQSARDVLLKQIPRRLIYDSLLQKLLLLIFPCYAEKNCEIL